ncbi:POK9 protein, partial [Upupa epops]|nr:POK9 protein [Upupa epops]
MAAKAAAMHPLMKMGNCYGCGKPGHLKKNCLTTNAGAKHKAPGVCPRCQKGCHFANQCQSKYDFQSQLIQGNRPRSAGRRCTQTQTLQLNPQTPRMEAAAPQVFGQQPSVVPDWIW